MRRQRRPRAAAPLAGLVAASAEPAETGALPSERRLQISLELATGRYAMDRSFALYPR